jgi:hypothetical protein
VESIPLKRTTNGRQPSPPVSNSDENPEPSKPKTLKWDGNIDNIDADLFRNTFGDEYDDGADLDDDIWEDESSDDLEQKTDDPHSRADQNGFIYRPAPSCGTPPTPSWSKLKR